MGLTKTNSKELSRIFDKRIIDFLTSSELVMASKPTSNGCSDNLNEIEDSVGQNQINHLVNEVTDGHCTPSRSLDEE